MTNAPRGRKRPRPTSQPSKALLSPAWGRLRAALDALKEAPNP